MSQLTSLINRVLFVVAFVLAGLAVLEKAANLFGYTVLGSAYEPGRLLEFASIALLFVFALLLREIRRALVSKRGTP
jgi:hypothetical protein